MLRLMPQDLQGAPAFSGNTWPNILNPEYMNEINTFYQPWTSRFNNSPNTSTGVMPRDSYSLAHRTKFQWQVRNHPVLAPPALLVYAVHQERARVEHRMEQVL